MSHLNRILDKNSKKENKKQKLLWKSKDKPKRKKDKESQSKAQEITKESLRMEVASKAKETKVLKKL